MGANPGHTYEIVEEQVYDYIVNTLGYNTAVACAILANIERESGFNPDEGHSRMFFENTTGNHTGGPYGLLQWSDTRLEKLKTSARLNVLYENKVILQKQLNFIGEEIENSPEYWNSVRIAIMHTPNTSAGAYKLAITLSKEYLDETNDAEANLRGRSAENKYWNHYSRDPAKPVPLVIPDYGKAISEITQEHASNHVTFPNTLLLLNRVYKEAGVPGFPKQHLTVTALYNDIKDSATTISLPSSAVPGDILFCHMSKDITDVRYYIDVAGTKYIVSVNSSGTIEYTKSYQETPLAILRVLPEMNAITSGSITDPGSSGGSDSGDSGLAAAQDYIALTSIDPYATVMADNLSKVEAEGYDFGYLIDMVNGGEFKFYVPEFSERAGANYGTVNIRGRSVTIQDYTSTNSRSISIALELYAGEGVYKAKSGESGEDTVSRMHSDAFFLKSLEYPDYSSAVVLPPPTVHLILGSAVNIAGIVSDVSIEHKKPLDSQNRAMYLKVSFTVTQTAINPPSIHDIRKGQYAIISTPDVDTMTE